MNKIFKVIWNHATQTFVVVSELTKSNGKSSSTTDSRVEPSKALLAISVAGAALLGSAQAMAATATTPLTDSTGTALTSGGDNLYIITNTSSGGTGDGIAIGYNATATDPGNTGNAIAIGRDSSATGQYSAAIGSGANASGTYATAVGNGTVAANTNSTAIGSGANASGALSTAVGVRAKASGSSTLAMGDNSNATGTNAVSIGVNSTASGTSSYAGGSFSSALADFTVALGSTANASAANSVAIGNTAGASGESSVALGGATRASGERAIAIGRSTWSTANRSTAIGQGVTAAGDYSVALGVRAETATTATSGIAIGNGTIASAANTTVLGTGANATTSATNSNVIGKGALSNATNSTIIGTNASVAASNSGESIAIGSNATIAGSGTGFAVAIGNNATTNGINSMALGRSSSTSGQSSIAVGTFANASSNYAIATGMNSTASAENSIATGHFANASASGAIATGTNSTASAVNSIATGTSANATGVNSTAIGAAANATAVEATALGRASNATAANTTAIGSTSAAIAENATALGAGAQAAGTYSVAINGGAAGASSVAVGQASKAGADYVVAIGNDATVDTSSIASIAIGNSTVITGTDSVAIGNTSYALAANATAVGANAIVQTAKNVALGANSIDDKAAVQVTTATVGSLTYGSFAGTADSVVSVGANGTERQIINVAPGEISATSTDAINGSQLYYVAAEVAKGYNVTSNNGTNVTLLPGAQTNFLASGLATVTHAANATTNGVDVTYSVAQGTFDSTTDGSLVANTTNTGVATVADVVNAVNAGYWKVGDGSVINNVTFGDEVHFVNGTNTTVTVTKDNDNKTTISYDVDLSKVNVPDVSNTTLSVTDGKVATPAEGDKLVNASTVADAINGSGWNVTSAATGNGTVSGTSKELINPGETVTFLAGDNMVLTQAGNNFTYATSPNVTFTNANVTSSLPTSTVKTGEDGSKTDTTLLNLTNAGDTVVTAKDLANYGWLVATPDNNYNAAVKNANTVNFIGDNHISVKGANNATTGSYDVTIKLADAGSISFEKDDTAAANNTGAVIAGPESPTGFVSAKTVADAINGSGWRTNSTTATDGATETLVNPGEVVNFEAGKNIQVTQNVTTDADGKDVVSYTYSTIDNPTFTNVTIGGNTTTDAAGNTVVNNPITIGTDANGNNTISNLTTTLPNTTSVGSNPTTTSPITADEAQNIANTSGSNAATLGDVLNAGWNLQGNGEAKDFVKPYDTVNFINGNGTTAVVTSNGTTSNVTFNVNVDNDTITINDKGQLVAKQSTTQVNGGDVTGPVNLVDGNTTTVTNTADGIKVEVKTTPLTNNDNGTVATPADPNAIATAGDVANVINNSGWTAAVDKTGTGESTDKGGDSLVNPGDTVKFIAGDNMNITKEGLNYTIATKKDVKFDTVAVDKGLTIGSGDNAVNMTPTTTNVANGDISPAVDMNGATFTNMTSNLPDTTSVGNNPTTNAPLTAQEAQDLANKSGSNAATLGDVLNAGWNLQGNGVAKDFVKPYDTVNFVNGAGTTADVTSDGNVSNVTYNVNVDNTTTEITYTDAAGNTLYKLADGSYNTDRDGKGTTVNAGDVTGSQVSAKTSPLTNNEDGTVNTPASPNALATAGDVANAINNSGFTLTTSKSDGEVEGTSNYKVNPGKTVTIDAGKNIKVTQKDGVVSVATKDNVEFSSVKTDEITAGPVTINKDGINAGGTKITNVAPGTDGTDAVNVNQLKQVAGDIHNKLNRNNKDLRAGIAGANAAAGLPQVYIPGKSMVAAAAGTFKGQSAVAVGYSRASDNGKLILKLQGNANTRGDIGGSVGVGYQW